MQTKQAQLARSGTRGFSLMELIISLAVLTTVVGVAVDGMLKMQQRKAMENSKIDLVQESREFMDQIVNDIHQVGYPSSRMFDLSALAAAPCPAFLSTQLVYNGNNLCPPNIAVGVGGNGLNSITSTSVQFEADVDGTGVSEVFIQLAQTNGVNAAPCTTPPCIIQRGVISKQAWINGNSVLYYTELGDVMNTTIFAAYNNDGSPATLPATTKAGLSPVTDIGVTLYVKGITPDAQTGLYPTATMVSDVKLRLN